MWFNLAEILCSLIIVSLTSHQHRLGGYTMPASYLDSSYHHPLNYYAIPSYCKTNLSAIYA